MDLVGPYYALAALYQRRCSLRLSNYNITIPIRGRDYIAPIFYRFKFTAVHLSAHSTADK